MIKRRIAALEKILNSTGLDREISRALAASRPEVEAAAKSAGMSAEAFEDEVRAGQRRIAEIGRDAWSAEVADQLGIPVEDVEDIDALQRHIDRMDREYSEWLADVHSKQVWYRAGVKYVGGVAVE